MDEHLWAIIICVGGIGGSLICWMLNRGINRHDRDFERIGARLDAHDEAHAEGSLALERFKAEVAKEYAKDATIQQSLARVHERIDEGFSELRQDIKTILQRTHP